MRLRHALIAVIFTTVTLVGTGTTQAKHRYFANFMPLTNYLNRCLGFGWSDGYHAPGGWPVRRHAAHRLDSTPSHPAAYRYYSAPPAPAGHPMRVPTNWTPAPGNQQPHPAVPLGR